MNGQTLFTVVLAVGIGFFTAGMIGPPEARAQKDARAATGYEYKVVEFSGRDPEAHAQLLNKLAADGWEYAGLVNIHTLQEGGRTTVNPSGFVAFKRSKK